MQNAENGMGVHSQYRTSTPHILFFSDTEIIAAAFKAYDSIFGTITHADVYVSLGIRRRTREWDRREEIVSHQRMAIILKNAGFIPAHNRVSGGCRARYLLPDGTNKGHAGVLADA